jgi:hypothetical protein
MQNFSIGVGPILKSCSQQVERTAGSAILNQMNAENQIFPSTSRIRSPVENKPCVEQTTAPAGPGLLYAIRELRSEIKALIRQEIELAKTEASEKVRLLKRNIINLALGGFIAYAALIVLLFGLSGFVALGFAALGLSQLISAALAHTTIALIVGLIGYMFIRKATKAFSTESLAPEKTLESLGRNHGGNGKHDASMEPAAMRPSSKELKSSIDQTQQRLSALVGEVTHRLSPNYIVRTALPNQLKLHPVRAAIIAASTGTAGFFFLKGKLQQRRKCG